jgi:hypothetical protein
MGVQASEEFRAMKSRDALVRAASFVIAEQRRKVGDLEAMIDEFRRIAKDLEQQIESEHMRTGVREPGHFAYSSFAKAARKRCDNLLVSVADLQLKLEAARRDLTLSEQELVRLQNSSDHVIEERPMSARRSSRSRPLSLGSPSRSA